MSEEPTNEESKTMPGKNGGVLLVGNPDNRGGGRQKDELRAKHFSNADAAASYVKTIIDAQSRLVEQYQAGEIDETTFLATRLDDQIMLRILDYSSKYSIGTKAEVEIVKADLLLWETLLKTGRAKAKEKGLSDEFEEILRAIEVPDDWFPAGALNAS